MCDFTGSRTVSDAKPGRCTGTGGYLSLAEISELIKLAGSEADFFYDGTSNSDILLYGGMFFFPMVPWSNETKTAIA
jgi:hypothetical protein